MSLESTSMSDAGRIRDPHWWSEPYVRVLSYDSASASPHAHPGAQPSHQHVSPPGPLQIHASDDAATVPPCVPPISDAQFQNLTRSHAKSVLVRAVAERFSPLMERCRITQRERVEGVMAGFCASAGTVALRILVRDGFAVDRE